AAAGAAAARRAAGSGQGAGALGAGASGGAFGGGASGGGRLAPGQGPRAALPGRDGDGGRPGAQGGARGPQGPGPSSFEQSGPPQGRPSPAGAGGGFGQQAPGAPQGLQAAGTNGPQQNQDAFGGGRSRKKQGGNAEQGKGRRPQLPPRGGPRAELPGGDAQQRVPSWSDENAQPPVPRASLDAPRGHEEQPDVSRTAALPRVDDRQGPGATAEIPAVPHDESRQGFGSPTDFGAAQDPFGPGANAQQGQGQFVRPDVFGTPGGRGDSSTSGQYPAPQSYDNGSTGQYPAPRQENGATGQYPAPRQDNGSTGHYPAPRQDNGSTGQYPAPRQDNGSGRPTLPGPATPADPAGTGRYEQQQVNGGRGPADFGAPRPPAPQARPVRQEPEALPPASGPGDGRTPLYDTLETNWFHGQQEQQPQNNGSAPAAPQQPQGPTGPQRSAAPAGWRTSPNDDLVRQAERVRQPAAGGVTTSGLPRRVPRANLVPGTAQQQTHQSGPQVSRAPDDVRGRLTNLRRGIAQGRQAGSTQTGSHPRPTHQQER
ncbi:hypothetical protein GTY56_22755, partial [Streptomyces sp. SID5643]|nr:hypothetical protein [Streptomyces sp. SID5643]